MEDNTPQVPATQNGKNPAYRVWRDVPQEVRANSLLEVIRRFADGERLADISPSVNLSPSALSMALLEYAEDDWKRAQVARAVAELEKAESTREAATDMLNLARARDAEKSAQWKLERLCRRLFGQDTIPASQAPVQININLRGSPATEGRVITPE